MNGVSRPNHFPPLTDSIRTNQFHPNGKIRGHKVDEVGEKGFALMLLVELFSIRRGHLKHFQISDNKLLFDSSDDFADVEIGIRFDHGIGSG